MEYEHTFKAPQSCSIVILHKSSELVAGRRRWCGAIQGGQSRIFTKTNVVKYF